MCYRPGRMQCLRETQGCGRCSQTYFAMWGGFQQYLFQLFAIARGFFLAQQLQFELPRSDTLRSLNAKAAEFTQIARSFVRIPFPPHAGWFMGKDFDAASRRSLLRPKVR
jgi:hypothetical protein